MQQARRVIAGLDRLMRRRAAGPDDRLLQEVSALRSRIEGIEAHLSAAGDRYLPDPSFATPTSGEFMQFSTCSSADFMHPRYAAICAMLDHPASWHRKVWEWVFIVHHILESGVAEPGGRGLAFGVGTEPLPALFAGLGAHVVATDAPTDVGESEGWVATGQHVGSVDHIRYPDIVDGDVFDANVSYRTCDMRDISADLTGFDFNWSSCCFEHLGSLQAGMDFVVNAVENTLRPGGVAVHTTEFNLTSDERTVEDGATVIYRHRDIAELVQRLRDRGHTVKDFIVAPPSNYWDFHVDTPPYNGKVHLKLLLGQYVTTSIGLVIHRGA